MCALKIIRKFSFFELAVKPFFQHAVYSEALASQLVLSTLFKCHHFSNLSQIYTSCVPKGI